MIIPRFSAIAAFHLLLSTSLEMTHVAAEERQDATGDDPCATQDAALDACLEMAGATDSQKTSCDICVMGVSEDVIVKGAIGSLCPLADQTACETFMSGCEDCLPASCMVETVAKGECEVDDARSDSGSNCPVLSCGSIPTPAPATAPLPNVTISCPTEDAALESCLQEAGATVEQMAGCESCIELVAKFAGLTSGKQQCAEADGIACSVLATYCDCLPDCQLDVKLKGECEIDAERVNNGNVCDPILCTGSTAPLPTNGGTVPPTNGTETVLPPSSSSEATAATVQSFVRMAGTVLAVMAAASFVFN